MSYLKILNELNFDGIEKWDVSQVKNMEDMFKGVNNLKQKPKGINSGYKQKIDCRNLYNAIWELLFNEYRYESYN